MTTAEDVERAKTVRPPREMVRVRWTCRHRMKETVGDCLPFRKVCGWTGEADGYRDEFNAKVLRARCGSCGGMLTQSADVCEALS